CNAPRRLDGVPNHGARPIADFRVHARGRARRGRPWLARPAVGTDRRGAPRLRARGRALAAARGPARGAFAATLPVLRRAVSSGGMAPPMRPDIVSRALFTRIAEAKSITKAAEASHIALAAASRRVAQLEDQLGVQLLFRTARGVEVTPAGNALLF